MHRTGCAQVVALLLGVSHGDQGAYKDFTAFNLRGFIGTCTTSCLQVTFILMEWTVDRENSRGVWTNHIINPLLSRPCVEIGDEICLSHSPNPLEQD